MANLTTPRRRLHRLANKLALGALLGLASCSPSALVDKTEIVADKVWKDQTLSFEFDVQDTTQTYDVVLHLTHDADFAYQNLYTLLTVNFPPPAEPRTNQLSMQLADQQGNWQGKCSGNTCTIALAFMTQTKFAHTGKHSLTFQQYSRAEQVEGVENLRLQIIPSTPNPK